MHVRTTGSKAPKSYGRSGSFACVDIFIAPLPTRARDAIWVNVRIIISAENVTGTGNLPWIRQEQENKCEEVGTRKIARGKRENRARTSDRNAKRASTISESILVTFVIIYGT